MTLVSLRARRVLTSTAVTAAVLVIACQDILPPVERGQPSPSVPASAVRAEAADAQPLPFSVEIGASGGTLNANGPGSAFAYKTLVRVSLGGTVSSAAGAYGGINATFGPEGYNQNGACRGQVLAYGGTIDQAGISCSSLVGKSAMYALGGTSWSRSGWGSNSCSDGQGHTVPCSTFSGKHTLSIERIPVVMALELNRPEVLAGDTVLFTRSLSVDSVNAGNGWLKTPFENQQNWTWVVNGVTTYPCAWNVSTCKVKVLQGGKMTVGGRVNGVMQSVSLNVRVVPAVLSVTCKPVAPEATTLSRGDPVRCIGRLSPAIAATLKSKRADFEAGSVEEVGSQSIAAGDSIVWQGRAVISSQVSMRVSVPANGAEVELTATASFAVAARAWKVLNVSQPPEELSIWPLDRDTLGLGAYDVDPPSIFSVRVESVAPGGPNAGLVWVRDEPELPRPWAALSPILKGPNQPGSWYADQNGGVHVVPSTGEIRPRCTATDLETKVIPDVRRHEGITNVAPSHYHEDLIHFPSFHDSLNGKWEAIVRPNAVADSIKVGMYRDWLSVRSYMWTAFHSPTGLLHQFEPSWFERLGCELDMDPTDS
jgi:hypothetical protein